MPARAAGPLDSNPNRQNNNNCEFFVATQQKTLEFKINRPIIDLCSATKVFEVVCTVFDALDIDLTLTFLPEPHMSQIPQQFLDSQKSALEAMISAQTTLFSGFEKLVDLNLKVMKASMDEVSEKSAEAIAIKDPQEAVALTSALAQPAAEKAMAYSKHIYDIVTGVQADLSKLGEAHIATGQKNIHEAVEQLSKHAPTGAEGAVAIIKSSLAQATGAFEAMTKAAKQAGAVAEKNLSEAASASFKVANQAAEAVKTTTARGRRTAA